MKKLLAASLLSANPLRLERDIKRLEEAGIDMLHIDIMDGHFVPNLTFGPHFVKAIKNITTLPLDVHLMVQDPENHIKAFVNSGSDFLTVHLEATKHLDRTLNQIKDLGTKAGVALLPSTPPEALDYVLDIVDLVLVMSVNPGFGGQKFISSQLDKINVLSKKLGNTILSVDGGINEQTISQASSAGANLLVSGNYIFQDEDSANSSIANKIARLKNLL
jgi:ribulose-phosphate 3-epimerase